MLSFLFFLLGKVLEGLEKYPMNAVTRFNFLNRWSGAARIALFLIMIAGSVATVSAAGPTAARTSLLQITAPERVDVGEPIVLTLTLQRAVNVAGYEATILFDSSVAEFAGLEQQNNDLRAFGRDVASLAAVDLPHGVAIGLYSCPVEDCVSRAGNRQNQGQTGTVGLGRLSLVANQPGVLEIAFDAIKVVDAAGNPIVVRMQEQRINVRVGEAGPLYTAPAAMWSLPAGSAAPTRSRDLTGDGLVTHADVAEIALAWETTRLNGNPCAAVPEEYQVMNPDVNGDGCVDVSDLQQAAAEYAPAGAASNQGATTQALAAGATFTVNAVADGVDVAPGNGLCATSFGYCTLRAAIQESNALTGPNNIYFNLPGSDIRTIQLTGSLPALNDASGGTTIDGYTQSGASPNNDPLVSNAVILVQVRGNGPTAFDGLKITSAGNTIRGLSFFNFRRALWIYGNGADNNVIVGNFIGTDAAGNFGHPALANNAHGIHMENSPDGNQIGDTTLAGRNVISGNAQSGVGIWHEGSDNNVIVNNILGLGPAGDKEIPNRRHAMDLNYGANHTQVGGLGVNERNVASGNDYSGIEISHVETTAYNQVVGNYFGTNVTGTAAPAWAINHYTGVTIEDRASHNTITQNIISNNQEGGVQITGLNTSFNEIYDNWIGVSVTGTPMGNHGFGVRADGRYNTVGPNNIIAHNAFSGIVIREHDKDYNTFTRNSWYSNGAQGIDLYSPGVNPNDAGDVDTGPNEQLNHPVLSSASPQQVSGTVCANCIVEVYIADRGAGLYGQGKTFIGSAVANGSGNFTVGVSGVAAGEYVTSLATDPTGNTSEFSLNLLVSSGGPPPQPTVYVEDNFNRNLSQSWGNADLGGPYTYYWGNTANQSFDTNGSAGLVTIGSTNLGREAILQNVNVRDVDITFRVETNKTSVNNSQEVLAIARWQNDGTMYRGRIRLTSTGAVYVQGNKGINGTWTTLGQLTLIEGASHSPSSGLWVRMQVVGANPTTINMKVWNAGQSEPAGWQFSVTDSAAALQVGGAVGLRVFVSSTGSNVPVIFQFDEYRVVSTPS
jgi:CSLREA domain-containing protein